MARVRMLRDCNVGARSREDGRLGGVVYTSMDGPVLRFLPAGWKLRGRKETPVEQHWMSPVRLRSSLVVPPPSLVLACYRRMSRVTTALLVLQQLQSCSAIHTTYIPGTW